MLTSANGATRLLRCLRDARDLGGVRVAAIGPGTADALLAGNVVADLVPEDFVAESLLDVFPNPPDGTKGSVLLARAEVARAVLPEGLRAKGWVVDEVDAYRTVVGAPTADALDRVAEADIVTFTSSSTVERFLDVVGIRSGTWPRRVHRADHGADGPRARGCTSTSRRRSTPSTASSPRSSRSRGPRDATLAPTGARSGDRGRARRRRLHE